MKTIWTNGLTPERKEELRSAFNASGYLRERLQELAQNKINAARKSSISKDAYDSPNWGYLQADTNGYIRALEEIQSLLQ